jgi:hypothetical protein
MGRRGSWLIWSLVRKESGQPKYELDVGTESARTTRRNHRIVYRGWLIEDEPESTLIAGAGNSVDADRRPYIDRKCGHVPFVVRR